MRAEKGLGINQFASTIAEELDITTEAMRRAEVPESQIGKLRNESEKLLNKLKGC